MAEFFQACFHPVILPFTILLALVFVYWLMIVVGALGLDAFDVDLDADVGHVDVGVDAGLDADIDASADVGHASGGPLMAVLKFFNLGEVPLMIVVSVFVFSMWATSILTLHYFNSTASVLAAMLWLAPNVIVSLFLAKIVTMPFKVVFRNINSGMAEPLQIVGKTCEITTGQATPRFGRAKFPTDGAPLILNVRTKEGITLNKGDEALVVEYDPDHRTYLVVKFDLQT